MNVYLKSRNVDFHCHGSWQNLLDFDAAEYVLDLNYKPRRLDTPTTISPQQLIATTKNKSAILI